jgi:hypothetical protein
MLLSLRHARLERVETRTGLEPAPIRIAYPVP